MRPTPNQQWHHHVFEGRELRQEVVYLPYEPDFPIAEVRLVRRRQTRNLPTSVVYRTP